MRPVCTLRCSRSRGCIDELDMKDPRSENPLHPSNWGQVIFIALLRGIACLPWRWATSLGAGLGHSLYYIARSRRYVVRRNLELCFPDLRRPNARSGSGPFSALPAVAQPRSRSAGLAKAVEQIPCRVDGLHHLRTATEHVILLSGHFCCVELAGRLFGQHARIAVIYKPIKKKPLFDRAMRRGREKNLGQAIPRDDIRGILRTLKAGTPVWYATRTCASRTGSLLPFSATRPPPPRGSPDWLA